MQSITSFNLLTSKPTIMISHKGLEAIKKIVLLAPQEAQWFHTVTPVYSDCPQNHVHLHLSEKLYIPEQNTSIAQVDTTSKMMVSFYKDLQEDYQDQQIINDKISSMTCWCHSHHNMSPSPSSQDNLQFDSFVNSSSQTLKDSWQVMLIFNKKNKFYSRVYDPRSKTVIEGVPIQLFDDYDFSYIHAAAKNKFIPPKKSINFFGTKKAATTFSPNFNKISDSVFEESSFDLAVDIAYDLYPNKDISDSAKITTTREKQNFISILNDYFDLKEMEIFYYFLLGDKRQIIKSKKKPSFTEAKIKKHIAAFISDTSFDVETVTRFIAFTLETEDISTSQELLSIINEALND